MMKCTDWIDIDWFKREQEGRLSFIFLFAPFWIGQIGTDRDEPFDQDSFGHKAQHSSTCSDKRSKNTANAIPHHHTLISLSCHPLKEESTNSQLQFCKRDNNIMLARRLLFKTLLLVSILSVCSAFAPSRFGPRPTDVSRYGPRPTDVSRTQDYYSSTKLNSIMEIVGTSPEPIHSAFSLATFGPQPFWVLLILLPKADITKKIMGSLGMLLIIIWWRFESTMFFLYSHLMFRLYRRCHYFCLGTLFHRG